MFLKSSGTITSGISVFHKVSINAGSILRTFSASKLQTLKLPRPTTRVGYPCLSSDLHRRVMFFGSEDLRSKRLWNIHESLIYSPDAAAPRDVASWRILSSDLTRYEQIQKLGRFLRCEMQWGRAAFEHRGSKSRIRFATLKLLRFNEVVFQDFCSRNGKRSNFFSRRFNNAR